MVDIFTLGLKKIIAKLLTLHLFIISIKILLPLPPLPVQILNLCSSTSPHILEAINLKQFHRGAILSGSEFSYWHYDCEGQVQSQASTNNQSINFTIKDKKEQCAAIGFKPNTEKFADCVLRLVELDVKRQTTNQIAE